MAREHRWGLPVQGHATHGPVKHAHTTLNTSLLRLASALAAASRLVSFSTQIKDVLGGVRRS
jgi:hypothetical protein